MFFWLNLLNRNTNAGNNLHQALYSCTVARILIFLCKMWSKIIKIIAMFHSVSHYMNIMKIVLYIFTLNNYL